MAMDSSDMEMDTAETAPAPAPATDAADGSNLNRQMENAWSLLSRARQLLTEGNPTLALQAVLSAIRSEGGDHAVIRAMSRAREMYRQQSHSNSQSDTDLNDLAALLAQCAIAEASNSPSSSNSHLMRDPNEMLSKPDAILAEAGRKQVMLDAFNDGSSFICLKCGGLFSGSRKDAHLANWCQ
ncbi:hypothetical protein LUZ60_001356 [Juncus effusus]|nr:hypothetical protein LUZ60_001356 [Juncus effusus]